MNLEAIRKECLALVRKTQELDTKTWLQQGVPRGAGLPPLGRIAAQIVALQEVMAAYLRSEQRAYVDYVKGHPPTKEPVSKAALRDLPLEATLTYHHWLENVTLRRGVDGASAFETGVDSLVLELQALLEEALGEGGIAARRAAGALPPGFASLSQSEAKALLKEIAPLKRAPSPEARVLYETVSERASTRALRGAVLRDGAGRVLGAATYTTAGARFEVRHLGALDRQVPGAGVQMIRELAGRAATEGKGITLRCPPSAVKVFTDLGFAQNIAKAADPMPRLALDAAGAAKLAAVVPTEGPAWTRVGGFLEGSQGTVSVLQAAAAPEVVAEVEAWGGIRGTLARTAAQSTIAGATGPVLVMRGTDGAIWAVAQYELPAGSDTLLLISLSVNPSSPVGGGVGRRTMREVAVIASRAGRGIRVDQPTAGALGFYERIGMTAGGNPAFTVEQAATFASGLTGGGTAFVGQISWELAVAGSGDWLRDHQIKGIVDEVGATTHQALLNTLADGLAQGESTDEIALRVQNLGPTFGPARAQRIARSEVLTANRFGGLQLATDAGCETKQWLANVGSPRTRAWHRAANGQRVKITDPFLVANGKGIVQMLMVPGDYSLGATPDNSVNCRCGCRWIKQGVSDDATLGIDEHGLAASHSAPGPVVAGEDLGPVTVHPEGEATPGFAVPAPVAKEEWAPGPNAQWKFAHPNDQGKFASYKDAMQWANRTYDPVAEDTAKALADYENAGYKDVNRVLRKGEELEADEAAQIKAMDAACAANPTEEDVLAYRMLPGDSFATVNTKAQAEKLVGRVFEEKGFMSTSISPTYPSDPHAMRDYPIEMHVKVPKGTPSYAMIKLGWACNYPEEGELLLGRGRRFIVESATKQAGTQARDWRGNPRARYVIEARIIQ